MGQDTSPDDANRILSDVPPEKSFWINNGPIVSNIQNLPDTLEGIDDSTFRHHVNEEKNDFAVWIADAVGDQTLARYISKAGSKKSFIHKLRKRIATLKKSQVVS